MYFKKLELFGFKSFADRTVLNFEPGITAIVGPNGCGKSNIFDAIRWTLGEQSTKELRGASMEDVIFNGTAQKPSLGFAEVSLTFANQNRALAIEYDEVTITRRLFRSGESEYMINKTIVRLKDIQELLMGTGIGAEAYSLVQQGKVDLVVSARPEDRRMIFDEAAGITKYKSKKKEALNKLKDTENNLLRLNDIVIEVKRQIGSIERQANKARKYQEEFKNLEALEVRLARRQMGSFGTGREEIHARIEAFKNQELELSRQMEGRIAFLDEQMNGLAELEQKINDLHAEEIKLDGQMDLDNRQIGFNQERVDGIRQNSERLQEQKKQLIERCRTQQEKVEKLKQELEAIRQGLQINEETLKEKRVELKRCEGAIKEAKDRIVEDEEKIMTLTSQQVSVRNELTDVMKEVQGALARKRRLEIEREKVSVEHKDMGQKLSEVEGETSALHERILQLEKTREDQGALLDRSRAALGELKQTIHELEKKAMFFSSQKDFIERLHAQYQDIPDPVVEGRLITPTAPLDHHTGIIGKVKEVQSVQNGKFGFFKNLFAKNDVQQLYEIICEAKFIELDPQQVSRKIEEIHAEVEALKLQEKTDAEKIEQEVQVFRNIQQGIHDQEKALSVVKAQKEDLLEENTKLREELELLVAELQEVDGSLAAVRKCEEQLNYQLDTVTQDIGWCQADIKNKREAIAARSQEKESVTVAIAQMETELENEKEKLVSSQEHLDMFSRDLDGWLEEIKRIDDEAALGASRVAQLEKDVRALAEKIEESKRQKESLKEVTAGHARQKQVLNDQVQEVRAGTTALEEEIDAIKQELHEQQMKEQGLAFQEKSLKDRLQQTYKINWDEMVQGEPAQAQGESADGAAQPEEAFNEEETVAEIERLRKRCEAFGSVNLVAIEEYEELKQRFEFLTKQQSDLLEAKSQLMDTISKINRSTRQMFMDTFNKVSEEFRIHYRMLFGGGDADLVLLDPENVLESGIDIIARPPGKKLQNISLLSGGEKTLTAIALIFGVFKVNPSPFCVLDEIDAALDDSNVGRFSYMLKEFARIAQFVVITHNKKTIASSDIMYGITMPETGVSRIVSVKFSDQKKEEAVLASV
ncbi:MAG: AAA family ATPase [Candidatus Omnitrophica bacterium]|nr:AAA family ATPase [Candidatus Omnitrophota bacterium]